MSFTEQVKGELAHAEREDKESRRAELLALLRMGGEAGESGGLSFSTGSSAVARRVLVFLKKDFGLNPAATVRQGRKLRKKNVYTLVVRPSPEGKAFLDAVDLASPGKDRDTLKSREEKRAYLAGAFLGGGTVNRPQGDYHLEMVTRSKEFAREIIRVMKSFKINARLTDRKNDFIVYIKDGDEVSGFLQIVGASKSYLDFESVRVVKDMRNRVNRQVNCETANLQKTVDAAVRQVHQVETLLEYRPLHTLTPKIRETCELRLAHPAAPLSELADICGISKSGLAHRFRKIADMVEELTGEGGLS